jgi:hypothetical protein
VLVVCVAVADTTLFAWSSAARSWSDRAALELGATRVLVVQADNSTHLLNAVRAVDPSGEFAMPAVVTSVGSPAEHTLAVDASRLGAVALLPASSYALPDPGALARELHPAAPTLARVDDGAPGVAVDVAAVASRRRRGGGARRAAKLLVWYENERGASRSAVSPLSDGPACVRLDCVRSRRGRLRLVGFEVVTERGEMPPFPHAITSRARRAQLRPSPPTWPAGAVRYRRQRSDPYSQSRLKA